MCHQFDLDELMDAFVKVATLTKAPLSRHDIQIEFLPAPHRPPSSLAIGKQAVYLFLLRGLCLKVGKAGSKSQARFTRHHSGANRAPSTLANSILSNRERLKSVVLPNHHNKIDTLDDTTVGAWIEQNTECLNIVLSNHSGDHTLSLLEAFLQCPSVPLFERKTA